MSHRRHDWAAIKRRYVTSELSKTELADEAGVCRENLSKRATKEGWDAVREVTRQKALQQAQDAVAHESAQFAVAERRAGMHVVQRTLQALAENLEDPSFRQRIGVGDWAVASRALRELTSALTPEDSSEATGEMTIVKREGSESPSPETSSGSSTNGNGSGARSLPYTPANGT